MESASEKNNKNIDGIKIGNNSLIIFHLCIFLKILFIIGNKPTMIGFIENNPNNGFTLQYLNIL